MSQNTMNIVAVQENHLLISLNGTLHRINKDVATLRQFVAQTNQVQIRIADNIYNIDKINEANFNLVTNNIKLPHRLSTYLPHLSKDQIVGRDKDIEQLHHLLSHHQGLVVVNAIGGLGKTTLIQAYVDTYYDHYQHLLWVTQNEQQSLNNAFINTKGLMTNLGIDTANINPASWFDMLMNALNDIEDQPNLLVIDNASEDLVNYRHLIPQTPNWHVLISSRKRIYGYTSYQLEQLSPSEALQLFNRYYVRNNISQADRQKLLEQVEYHTLTIELLAKTAQLMRFNAEQLLHALQNDTITDIVVPHQNNKTQHIDRVMSYVCSIFDLNNLNSDELYLLEQFACLPNIQIPYDHLQILLCSENSPIKLRLPILLEEVCNKGWLSTDSYTDIYRIHAIVAQVIQRKQRIQQNNIANLIEQVTKQLDLDQNNGNPVDKFVWIPYGETLVNTFENTPSTLVSQLQNNLALMLRTKGDYATAKILLQKALLFDEKTLGTEHPTTTVHYSNLATVLKILGEYDAAKRLLQKAILSAKKNFGADDPTTIGCYSNLATVLRALGKYKPAKKLLQKTIILAEKRLGNQHPSLAIYYTNLALVLKDLSEYQAAKILQQKAVTLNEKNFGTEHPTTAVSYSNLAFIVRCLAEYQYAKDLLNKAILISEKNFGTEHPTTVTTYCNLAFVLQDLHDYEAAKILLQKSIVIFKKTLPPQHPYIAKTEQSLAALP